MSENQAQKLRVRRWLIGAISFAAIALVFQNCAGYAPLTTTDATVASLCDPTATDCTGLGGLQLKVRSDNSQWIVTADQTAFDVGGDCDGIGYPITRIHWTLLNDAGQAVAGGTDSDGCDGVGRWRALVAIPAGSARGGAHYTFSATLTGVDSSGTEVTNAIGGMASQAMSVTVN